MSIRARHVTQVLLRLPIVLAQKWWNLGPQRMADLWKTAKVRSLQIIPLCRIAVQYKSQALRHTQEHNQLYQKRNLIA